MIVQNQNTTAVDSLILLIQHPADIDTLGDALKVLECIGLEQPELAKPAFRTILTLLDHKQNKIQWRAMSALCPISYFFPKEIYDNLDKVLSTMDQGSVITRDHGFKILVTLYQVPAYEEVLKELILEQVLAAPDNQLGQYAENWFEVISPKHMESLQKALASRSIELTAPSHQKRIARLMKKIYQQ